MKKALIYGVTGQDGAYLARILLKKKYIVHGVVRRSSSINTSRIDEIYKECLLAGASGGKIIGSGGGGFLLIYCKKKNHINLKRRINKLPIVNFNFINEGSKIVFKS